MAIQLLAPLWVGNARVQRAANNSPPMQKHEGDHAAVALLQGARMQSGFAIAIGADGNFLTPTANPVIATEKQFGFQPDGDAGREVFGALDLSLRGWRPPAGAHWGGLLAATIVPVAQRKVRAALSALFDIQTVKFDFGIADGVTLSALKTHFKLVIGGSRLPHEDLMSDATIPLSAIFVASCTRSPTRRCSVTRSAGRTPPILSPAPKVLTDSRPPESSPMAWHRSRFTGAALSPSAFLTSHSGLPNAPPASISLNCANDRHYRRLLPIPRSWRAQSVANQWPSQTQFSYQSRTSREDP